MTRVSVRPTRNGQWEVVVCTPEQDNAWRADWDKWFGENGERLQREHPDWWQEDAKHPGSVIRTAA